MERPKEFFRSPAAGLFLFAVFAALLGWPLLTLADQGRGAGIFWYLAAVWGGAILVLALTSRALKERPKRGASPERADRGPGDG
ncbi:MAG: hypothetical protein ACYC9Y_02985 [Candidatus Methylomirabilia bacterium]